LIWISFVETHREGEQPTADTVRQELSPFCKVCNLYPLVDAPIVGYYEGERLLYAAKVRNGFVPQFAVTLLAGSRAYGSRLGHLPTCRRKSEPNGL